MPAVALTLRGADGARVVSLTSMSSPLLQLLVVSAKKK